MPARSLPADGDRVLVEPAADDALALEGTSDGDADDEPPEPFLLVLLFLLVAEGRSVLVEPTNGSASAAASASAVMPATPPLLLYPVPVAVRGIRWPLFTSSGR